MSDSVSAKGVDVQALAVGDLDVAKEARPGHGDSAFLNRDVQLTFPGVPVEAETSSQDRHSKGATLELPSPRLYGLDGYLKLTPGELHADCFLTDLRHFGCGIRLELDATLVAEVQGEKLVHVCAETVSRADERRAIPAFDHRVKAVTLNMIGPDAKSHQAESEGRGGDRQPWPQGSASDTPTLQRLAEADEVLSLGEASLEGRAFSERVSQAFAQSLDRVAHRYSSGFSLSPIRAWSSGCSWARVKNRARAFLRRRFAVDKDHAQAAAISVNS